MENFAFFQNRDCEFFPCHKATDTDTFNCLFCYCPLYALGEACGGNYVYTEQGVKDCSGCLIPHKLENYNRILERIEDIIDLAKRNETNP